MQGSYARQHLADKQRGRCVSCRRRLRGDFCVRREIYPIGGDSVTVSFAQCPPCFEARRPRADDHVPGTPHAAFFEQFKLK